MRSLIRRPPLILVCICSMCFAATPVSAGSKQLPIAVENTTYLGTLTLSSQPTDSVTVPISGSLRLALNDLESRLREALFWKKNAHTCTTNTGADLAPQRLTMVPSQNELLFHTSGQVTSYFCRPNPVKCSKLDFEKKGPLGISEPKITFYDCNPHPPEIIDTRQVEFDFQLAAQVTARRAIGALVAPRGSMSLQTPMGILTPEQLVKLLPMEAISSALALDKIVETVSASIPTIDYTLTGAKITLENGGPVLVVELTAIADKNSLVDTLTGLAVPN